MWTVFAFYKGVSEDGYYKFDASSLLSKLDNYTKIYVYFDKDS